MIGLFLVGLLDEDLSKSALLTVLLAGSMGLPFTAEMAQDAIQQGKHPTLLMIDLTFISLGVGGLFRFYVFKKKSQ
jgi:hypothetical protein